MQSLAVTATPPLPIPIPIQPLPHPRGCARTHAPQRPPHLRTSVGCSEEARCAAVTSSPHTWSSCAAQCHDAHSSVCVCVGGGEGGTYGQVITRVVCSTHGACSRPGRCAPCRQAGGMDAWHGRCPSRWQQRVSCGGPSLSCSCGQALAASRPLAAAHVLAGSGHKAPTCLRPSFLPPSAPPNYTPGMHTGRPAGRPGGQDRPPPRSPRPPALPPAWPGKGCRRRAGGAARAAASPLSVPAAAVCAPAPRRHAAWPAAQRPPAAGGGVQPWWQQPAAAAASGLPVPVIALALVRPSAPPTRAHMHVPSPAAPAGTRLRRHRGRPPRPLACRQ